MSYLTNWQFPLMQLFQAAESMGNTRALDVLKIFSFPETFRWTLSTRWCYNTYLLFRAPWRKSVTQLTDTGIYLRNAAILREFVHGEGCSGGDRLYTPEISDRKKKSTGKRWSLNWFNKMVRGGLELFTDSDTTYRYCMSSSEKQWNWKKKIIFLIIISLIIVSVSLSLWLSVWWINV